MKRNRKNRPWCNAGWVWLTALGLLCAIGLLTVSNAYAKRAGRIADARDAYLPLVARSYDPGIQPGPTPIPSPTPGVVPPGGNLLVNGDFSDAFAGWNRINDYWGVHDITDSQCIEENPDWPPTMAEMDRDACADCNTWPVGGEDWLWQDVDAPAPHLTVTLTLTEAHHMYSGTAELTLYGQEDEGWQVIFHRPVPEAPFGAGHFCETPPSFSYSFPGGYPRYRLEIHGHLKEPIDGWIVGPFVLKIE
jgi:hypothetical protein